MSIEMSSAPQKKSFTLSELVRRERLVATIKKIDESVSRFALDVLILEDYDPEKLNKFIENAARLMQWAKSRKMPLFAAALNEALDDVKTSLGAKGFLRTLTKDTAKIVSKAIALVDSFTKALMTVGTVLSLIDANDKKPVPKDKRDVPLGLIYELKEILEMSKMFQEALKPSGFFGAIGIRALPYLRAKPEMLAADLFMKSSYNELRKLVDEAKSMIANVATPAKEQIKDVIAIAKEEPKEKVSEKTPVKPEKMSKDEWMKTFEESPPEQQEKEIKRLTQKLVARAQKDKAVVRKMLDAVES